jgi:hypothetical protein
MSQQGKQQIMSKNFPVLLSGGFYKNGNAREGYGSVILNSAGVTPNAYDASGEAVNAQFVAIYDRKTPLKGPVFLTTTSDNKTVPAGLAPYLTDQYIMFWASSCWVNSMPQGPLYDMLKANGGASQLNRMEVYSVSMACGINGGLVYLLASIPNTGVEGVEKLKVGARPGDQPTNILLEMIASPDGIYTPEELG